MEKVIHCPCGYVVRGKTEAELVENAMRHARQAHGATPGKLTEWS